MGVFDNEEIRGQAGRRRDKLDGALCDITQVYWVGCLVQAEIYVYSDYFG